jgi:hypothetical protein
MLKMVFLCFSTQRSQLQQPNHSISATRRFTFQKRPISLQSIYGLENMNSLCLIGLSVAEQKFLALYFHAQLHSVMAAVATAAPFEELRGQPYSLSGPEKDAAILRLMGFGFPRQDCSDCLTAANDILNDALEFLYDGVRPLTGL